MVRSGTSPPGPSDVVIAGGGPTRTAHRRAVPDRRRAGPVSNRIRRRHRPPGRRCRSGRWAASATPVPLHRDRLEHRLADIARDAVAPVVEASVIQYRQSGLSMKNFAPAVERRGNSGRSVSVSRRPSWIVQGPQQRPVARRCAFGAVNLVASRAVRPRAARVCQGVPRVLGWPRSRERGCRRAGRCHRPTVARGPTGALPDRAFWHPVRRRQQRRR